MKRFLSFFLKLLLAIVSILGFILSICPSKKGLIVFSQSRRRYSGNSRVLYEYMNEEMKDVYWLYESLENFNEEIKKNGKLVKRSSLQAMWLCSRAEFAVISHGLGDFGFLKGIVKYKKIVMLWHAITTKNVGLLDSKSSNKKLTKYLRSETRYYDIVTVSSEIERYYTSAYQGLDVRKIYTTGIPRTDAYILNKAKARLRNMNTFDILYAPTFRDYKESRSLFFPFEGFDSKKLAVFFQKNNTINLYLRPHPNDKKSVELASRLAIEFPMSVTDVSTGVVDDIDSILANFDAVITDYSSIYMEPLLADIPCIFIPFDKNEYISKRGLAYDYDLITPGPKVSSLDELFEAIINVTKGATEWSVQRKFVKKMFFKHINSSSCKRISKLIESI